MRWLTWKQKWAGCPGNKNALVTLETKMRWSPWKQKCAGRYGNKNGLFDLETKTRSSPLDKYALVALKTKIILGKPLLPAFRFPLQHMTK